MVSHDLEVLARPLHKSWKWTKPSIWHPSLTCIVVFLVITTGIMWMFEIEENQGIQINMVPWSNFRLPSFSNRRTQESIQAYLTCFSESGKWVYDAKPRRIPWNIVGEVYSSACDHRHKRSGKGVIGEEADSIAISKQPKNWSVREELKWVWQTNSSCPWRRMDRDDFCRQVGPDVNLLVVGDSLNHQITWSLLNALVTNTSKYEHASGHERIIGPFEMCDDFYGNERAFKVSFVRNDYLSTIDTPRNNHRGSWIEYPWLNLIEARDINLILLNRGAHYQNDNNYKIALLEALTLLKEKYPHIRVIYRNTQPGHMDCKNYTQPLLNPQQELKIPPNYHWQDFHRQNLLAKKIVEEFGFLYMDVEAMLKLRADGHVRSGDCLHYCIPGPLDFVVEYFYNLLLLL